MINWNKVRTGVGYASHVPEQIGNLFSPDTLVREKAYWKLDNYVVVQSDLYEAAFYIIEPIVKLLREPYKYDRLFALRILIEIAIGGNGHYKVLIIDNGTPRHDFLDDACRTKFKELKNDIEQIEVRTNEERSELTFLLHSI